MSIFEFRALQKIKSNCRSRQSYILTLPWWFLWLQVISIDATIQRSFPNCTFSLDLVHRVPPLSTTVYLDLVLYLSANIGCTVETLRVPHVWPIYVPSCIRFELAHQHQAIEIHRSPASVWIAKVNVCVSSSTTIYLSQYIIQKRWKR